MVTGEARFPVAILAGGLATRMRPVAERIPKALFEVAGKPFIEHQLALLRREGVEHVVLCVGFLGEKLGLGIAMTLFALCSLVLARLVLSRTPEIQELP